MGEKLMDAQTLFEPSFDDVAFSDYFFYFLRKFPRDYQMLSAMSPTQLSTFLEVQLMRCFLVENALKNMKVGRDDLKFLSE